jgi:hypothetical protein
MTGCQKRNGAVKHEPAFSPFDHRSAVAIAGTVPWLLQCDMFGGPGSAVPSIQYPFLALHHVGRLVRQDNHRQALARVLMPGSVRKSLALDRCSRNQSLSSGSSFGFLNVCGYVEAR